MKTQSTWKNYLKGVAIISLVLGLGACGSGGSSGSSGNAASSTAPNAVTISNFAFSPNSLTVPQGATVTWTNTDSIAHTSTADAGAWNSNDISTGQSFSFQFNTPGTYTYHCNVHPSMTATIVVQ